MHSDGDSAKPPRPAESQYRMLAAHCMNGLPQTLCSEDQLHARNHQSSAFRSARHVATVTIARKRVLLGRIV